MNSVVQVGGKDESSARSAMFIEPSPSKTISSVGATWKLRLLPTYHAAPTELVVFRFVACYQHGAPDRACGCAALISAIGHLRSFTLVLLLAVTLFTSGCVSNGGMSLDVQRAYIAGQEQALSQIHAPPPPIHFEGQVKNDTVPWQDGLTLSQAIVAAVYDSMMNPRRIQLVRQGETIDVDPKELLQGNDMPLQPGDVVKIMR